MSYSLYKVLSSRSSEQANAQAIKSVYDAELSSNNKLFEEYKYYSSSEYIEQVSRDNLDLADKGQSLIVLPNQTPASSIPQIKTVSKQLVSPLEQWSRLLFN